LPTGTVTFLFTDLEGSTRLWDEHPDAMKSALARHDELLRTAVKSHGGHVVKTTGDGLHAAFGTGDGALAAAHDGQRALANLDGPGSDFFTSTVIGTAAGLIARAAPAAATQLLGALDRYATESGIPGAPADVTSKQRTRARVEQALDAAVFAEAWALGAAMSIDEAAAIAHDELGCIET